MDGSRWLWAARWSPAILTVCSGLAFIIAFGQPQAEETLASRLLGGGPMILLSLSSLYQVLYILVYTDRALKYDVKPFIVSYRTINSWMETNPNQRGDRSRAYLRILLGLAIAFIAASLGLVTLTPGSPSSAAAMCVVC